MGVLGLGLALAACAPRTNVAGPPSGEAEAARRALQYAGATGPVLAVVRGDPLERPGRVEEALRAANQGVSGLDVAFTTDPALASRPDFKLVMLLNPERPHDPASACVEPAQQQGAGDSTGAPPQQDPNRPTLLAVFCEEQRPIAGALGDIEVAGPDDAGYARLVSRTTAALFPDDYWNRYGRFPFSVGVGVGSGGRSSVGVGVGIGL
jgi:hypothetical protein